MFSVLYGEPSAIPPTIRVKLCGLFSIHYQVQIDDMSWTEGPARERCDGYHMLSYLRARAMIYAIDEINYDTDILGDIKLEYDIRDICNWKSAALRAATQCLGLEYDEEAISLNSDAVIANQSALLFIGPDTSESAETVADYAQNFGVPLISYSATSALLSDRKSYRTFFRTVPSDVHQAAAVAELIASFGWNWVGMIALDNAYGRSVAVDFRSRAARLGICIAVDELVSLEVDEEGMQRLVDVFNQNPILEVVVAFTYTKTLSSILEQANTRLPGRSKYNEMTWIASDVWATSTMISSQNYTILGNVLGVVLQTHEIPGYVNYLSTLNPTNPKFENDTWLREIWETNFNCDLSDENKTAAKLCASHELMDLESVRGYSRSFSLYNVYLAVYAAAYTLRSVERCREPGGLLADGMCPDPHNLESWQLINYLKAVNFTKHAGSKDTLPYHTFNENGEMAANFCIIHWKREAAASGGVTASDNVTTAATSAERPIRFTEIGRFDVYPNGEGVLSIDTTQIDWHQDINKGQAPEGVCRAPCQPGFVKVSREGSPPCCFDCEACPVGSITNQTGRTLCNQCPEGTWSNENRTECIPKMTDVLVWQNPVAIVCLVLCGIGVVCTLVSLGVFIHHHDTAVVRASNRPLSYCLLCLLMLGFVEPVLYVGMPTNWSCNFRIALHSVLNAAILALFLVKTRRILAVFDTSSWRNASIIKRVLRNTSAQVVFFIFLWIIQGAMVTAYLSLAPSEVRFEYNLSTTKIYIVCESNLYCFIVMYSYIALIAIVCFVLSFRARKIPENFHETRYITVTMLFYIVIWIVSLPLYFSVNGSLQSLLQMITTWLSNAMILGFMFVPKCYIILQKPEDNTASAVRRKASQFPVGEFQSTLASNNDVTHYKTRSRTVTTAH
ncbi:extracellular calcium-sensing receptor-like [Diadema setosum]|uniref:extracellular calcium-sensing receptor-like n=1 Tax=Diadema setosum TaxID=31175 RepID=UPI003B3BB8CD